VQQDFERRGDRGRGDPDRGRAAQRGDDRDYDRIYDNYGESSGEFDPRERRSRGAAASERDRISDRDRSSQQPRQDHYADEMRGDPGLRQDRGGQERFEPKRFDQGTYGQRGNDQQRGSSRPSSPYDHGEMSSWYGGDDGMGDTGSSLSGGPTTYTQSDRGQFGRGQPDWDQPDWDQPRQRPSGWRQSSPRDSGWRESSRRQASSQFGQSRSGRPQDDQGQYRNRFRDWPGSGQGSWQGDGSQEMAGSADRHQSIEGPFTGRGPRGYHRSDERIREDVCDLLTRHGDIDASQMEVDVHNGVVNLRGMADSGRVRRLTEEVVEEISGVRDVRNDLRVTQRTGYAETMPFDQQPDRDRSGTARAGMDQSASGRSDWGRADTGHHETSQTGLHQSGTSPTAMSQTAMSQGGSADTGSSAYGRDARSESDRNRSGPRAQTTGTGNMPSSNRPTIREAMDVVGSDGVIVGQVKEARDTDFLVDRSMQRDVYVPLSAVQTIDGDRVLLNIPARDVDNQNCPTPDLTGTSQQQSR
jgi:osmotically-inducible protein OsmY